MLEEHGSVGGHLGDVAGADADVDEISQDGRDVTVKVVGKHPGDEKFAILLLETNNLYLPIL